MYTLHLMKGPTAVLLSSNCFNFVCFNFIALFRRFGVLKVTLNVELTFGRLIIVLNSRVSFKTFTMHPNILFNKTQYSSNHIHSNLIGTEVHFEKKRVRFTRKLSTGSLTIPVNSIQAGLGGINF